MFAIMKLISGKALATGSAGQAHGVQEHDDVKAMMSCGKLTHNTLSRLASKAPSSQLDLLHHAAVTLIWHCWSCTCRSSGIDRMKWGSTQQRRAITRTGLSCDLPASNYTSRSAFHQHLSLLLSQSALKTGVPAYVHGLAERL